MQERLTEKLMHADVQAFCRFAVMWADQRQMAFDAMATAGDVNFEGVTEATLFEDIVAGVFDFEAQKVRACSHKTKKKGK